ADVVGDEFEREELARIRDREHPREHLLQPLVLAASGLGVHLEEIAEALQLDLEQIRDLQVPLAVDLREVLPFLAACSLQGLPAFPNGKLRSPAGCRPLAGRAPDADDARTE